MYENVYTEKYGAAGNSFYLMDVLDALRLLLLTQEGRIELIYIDPPFDTGDSFSYKAKVGERGYGGDAGQSIELQAYSDRIEDYSGLMRDVLALCRQLLCATGSIYVHLDYRSAHKVRMIMDEIFGEERFVNEIIWSYKSGGRSKRFYSRKHDNILLYSKWKKRYFNIEAVGMPRGRDHRNHMKRTVDEAGNVVMSITSGGKVYTYTEESMIYPSDVWTDISHLQQKDPERMGFDTQKPEALLRRVILASSKEGDLVADFFSGSGTTAKVAASLNRRFIAVDSSPIAMQLLKKRIFGIKGSESGLACVCDQSLLFCAGDAEFSLSACEGGWEVELTGYAMPERDALGAPGAQGLDFVDGWGVGILDAQGSTALTVISHEQRTPSSPSLACKLTLPQTDRPAAFIYDSRGSHRLYPLQWLAHYQA